MICILCWQIHSVEKSCLWLWAALTLGHSRLGIRRLWPIVDAGSGVGPNYIGAWRCSPTPSRVPCLTDAWKWPTICRSPTPGEDFQILLPPYCHGKTSQGRMSRNLLKDGMIFPSMLLCTKPPSLHTLPWVRIKSFCLMPWYSDPIYVPRHCTFPTIAPANARSLQCQCEQAYLPLFVGF